MDSPGLPSVHDSPLRMSGSPRLDSLALSPTSPNEGSPRRSILPGPHSDDEAEEGEDVGTFDKTTKTPSAMKMPKVRLRRSGSLVQLSDGSITRRKGYGEDLSHTHLEKVLNSDVQRFISNLSCHIDAEERRYLNIPTASYNTSNILTGSLEENQEWRAFIAPKDLEGEVAEVAQIPFKNRTHDQREHMVQWLCEKWPTARQMGYLKCMAMTKALKYFSYRAGENIVVEGESGLTFYIIISGLTEVHKMGVGVVARLGAGFSFGEIALSGKVGCRTHLNPLHSSKSCLLSLYLLANFPPSLLLLNLPVLYSTGYAYSHRESQPNQRS